MEQTIYVWSNQNICDHNWRWSTLTSLVISLPLSIWQTCCLYYRSYCRTCSGLGQISSADSTIPFREWNFQNFNPEFLLNRKRSQLIWQSCALAAPGGHWCLHITFAPWWPDNHNYAGNPRFYRFRTVWAPFNFSYSKASCENEITSSHECHSSFLFPWFWFFFFFGEFSTCTNNSCLSWV